MSGGYPLAGELSNATDYGSSLTTVGVVVTGGHNTPGSWATVIAAASNAVDACWMEVSIRAPTGSSTTNAVDIGIGAAASEVVVANKLFAFTSTSGLQVYNHYFPCSIPSGTRIAARSSNSASTDSTWVSVRLFDGSFTETGGYAGVDALAFVSATTHGTLLTGGTAGVKGSYVQLIASTAVDYGGLFFLAGPGSVADAAASMIDIAIGASGSEINILQNMPCMIDSAAIGAVSHPYFIPIPAGTRVAARVSFGANAAATTQINVYGMYQ
jgi:hypothetical protein